MIDQNAGCKFLVFGVECFIQIRKVEYPATINERLGCHPSQSLIVAGGCRDVPIEAIDAAEKFRVFALERYAVIEPPRH